MAVSKHSQYHHTYKNEPGGSALWTFQHQAVLKRQRIEAIWQQYFVSNLDGRLLDAPGLIPMSMLQRSGHAIAFRDNANELYIVGDRLALRPQTCVAMFSYYRARYGKRPGRMVLMQAGRAYRNQRTSRGVTRLAQFTQLEVQALAPTSGKQVVLTIAQQEYQVRQAVATMYNHAMAFFKLLGLQVTPVVVVDRPFYSNFTVDFYAKGYQVGCVNDRGSYDLQSVYVTQLSCGLDRLYYCLS